MKEFWSELKEIYGEHNKADYVFDMIDCAKMDGKHDYIDSILSSAEESDVEATELGVLLCVLISTKTKTDIISDIKNDNKKYLNHNGSTYPSRNSFFDKVMSRCITEKGKERAEKILIKHK